MNSPEYSGLDDLNLTDDGTDEWLDSLCDYIARGLVPKDGDVSVLNPDGMKRFAIVYNAVKSSIHGKGVKITYGINEPFLGSGFIRIEGKKLKLLDTPVLAKASKLASNFEVYPLVNGKVRMAYTFDGLVLR